MIEEADEGLKVIRLEKQVGQGGKKGLVLSWYVDILRFGMNDANRKFAEVW